ncbi:hypothetical protein AO382_1254 [Moraxella catarrhalis]|uniref:Uncharacterized protein n=1 Tax=Moraxella catarrhalis TaxID=480 RepID=A0A7Z0UY39_MORCA|nr:hypothetical protein AO382_1254 [Moraxella catarrhalis]
MTASDNPLAEARRYGLGKRAGLSFCGWAVELCSGWLLAFLSKFTSFRINPSIQRSEFLFYHCLGFLPKKLIKKVV